MAPRKPYGNQQRMADYRLVFGTPEGQRVLHDLINRSWYFEPMLHESATVMGFRDGQRSMVADILKWCEMKPEDLRPAVDYIKQLFPAEAEGN